MVCRRCTTDVDNSRGHLCRTRPTGQMGRPERPHAAVRKYCTTDKYCTKYCPLLQGHRCSHHPVEHKMVPSICPLGTLLQKMVCAHPDPGDARIPVHQQPGIQKVRRHPRTDMLDHAHSSACAAASPEARYSALLLPSTIRPAAVDRTLLKRWARQQAAEPQAAAVAQQQPRQTQRPAPRRLPTAAEAKAAGIKWERPNRDWRYVRHWH